MKKIFIKCIFLSFIIGIFGLTTIFAISRIRSSTTRNPEIVLDGVRVPLNNDLILIEKDDEETASLYIHAAEIFEQLGYHFEFDSEGNTLILNSPELDNDLPSLLSIPESTSISNIKNTPMTNKIPEHFTSDGIAKTTQSTNAYTFEGVIGNDRYQFGNPYTVNEGDQLTFTLNSLEYVSDESMGEDENVLRVTFGDGNFENNRTGFNFMPKSLNEIALSMPTRETANHHITIINISGKEVKYKFTLTID